MHIVYGTAVIKNTESSKDLSVGDYDEWIKLSDHVPVMVEVDKTA